MLTNCEGFTINKDGDKVLIYGDFRECNRCDVSPSGEITGQTVSDVAIVGVAALSGVGLLVGAIFMKPGAVRVVSAVAGVGLVGVAAYPFFKPAKVTT